MKRTVLAFLKGCLRGIRITTIGVIAFVMVAFPFWIAVEKENPWYSAIYLLYLIIYFGLEGAFGHETD